MIRGKEAEAALVRWRYGTAKAVPLQIRRTKSRRVADRCDSALHRRLQRQSQRRSDDREVFADALENFEGAFEVGAFVRGGDDGAQPRLAFGNDGIANGQREDSFVEELAREIEGFSRFADDDGR